MVNDNNSPYEINGLVGDGCGSGVITPENMQLMHKRLLETIRYFDSFCRENHLTYCLMWGSLIGAVRHKGFIPWDDDVDVAMPRQDYDKLFQLWEMLGDKENYSLYKTDLTFCAKVPIGLLRNRNTTVIYDFNKDQDISHGVKIDIEAWDEVPDSIFQRFYQKINFRLFEVYATQRLPVSAPSMRSFRKLKIIIIKMLLAFGKSEKNRCRLAMKFLKRATRFNGKGCRLVRCNASTAPSSKTDVFDTIRVPFEDIELSVPKGYDNILTKEYGNYMEKPDVPNRHPNIEYFFYDLNSPCEKYKGKYYCIK